MRTSFFYAILFFVSIQATTLAQSPVFITRLQAKLDSLRTAGNFPGINIAVVGPEKMSIALSSGTADREKNIALKPGDYMLQGSVGKTYVSAIAMQLVNEGKLNLDATVSSYLGGLPWYGRLPNAANVTVRMLMNHTSGIMRYEFKDAFTKSLTEKPDKVWQPADLLAFVLDDTASFKAGKGWEYSDTNYIVLGLILEKLTGTSYYTLLKKRILKPCALEETKPSDSRKLPGLVQGYAGAHNAFGQKDEVIGPDGNFIINPQFEWTGGGIYSTTRDLAKWGHLLYTGQVTGAKTLKEMLTGNEAKELGRDTKYGLGIIIHQSQTLGTFYGHSGFFPGYLTELYYFPKQGLTFALQTNTSDFKNLKIYDLKILTLLAKMVADEMGL